MNILHLVSDLTQAVNGRLRIGLDKIGYEFGRELTVFPFVESNRNGADEQCSYSLSYEGIDYDDLIDAIRENRFDVAFIGNIWGYHQRVMYTKILEELGDLPCVLISEDALPFKMVWCYREMNWIAKFFSEKQPSWVGYPISYGEMEERTGVSPKEYTTFYSSLETDKRQRYTNLLIAAGFPHIYEGLRYGHREYLQALRKAWVTFSIPNGFHNSTRYIESPAQGVCLMAKNHSGIVEIRDDFIDGESAVFFDNPTDMMEKLLTLLANPGKLQAIAEAGREHVMTNHLVQHCARYVMNIVVPLL